MMVQEALGDFHPLGYLLRDFEEELVELGYSPALVEKTYSDMNQLHSTFLIDKSFF